MTAPVPGVGRPGDDTIVAALAAALVEAEARPQREADPHAIIETRQWTREARALLPVVRKAQADALRAAADYWDRPNIRTVAHDLRERAIALEAGRG